MDTASLKTINYRGGVVRFRIPASWNEEYEEAGGGTFYAPGDDSGDAAGIEFPGTKSPDYWDFAYFSFTLGMTFQTSDVAVTSTAIRKVVLFHCFAAFVFNIGVIAFTINVLGGG